MQENPLRCADGESAWPERAPVGQRARRGSPPVVLVAEDDRDVADAIVAVLEIEGYRVASAENGKVALEMLRSGLVPEAIVLDVMMPVMNGWEFRREQLADPALAVIPVIVVSADCHARSVAPTLGILEVLPKPADVDELLRTLERVRSR